MLKLHLYYPIVTGLVFLFICLLYLSLFWTVNQSARKAKAKRKERIRAAGHNGAKVSSSMGGLGMTSAAPNSSTSSPESGEGCPKGRVTISAQNSNNIEVAKSKVNTVKLIWYSNSSSYIFEIYDSFGFRTKNDFIGHSQYWPIFIKNPNEFITIIY